MNTDMLMLGLLLLFGIGLAIAIKRYVKPDVGDSLFASLIFIPAIAWMMQGMIQGLILTEVGFLGFSAKFAAQVNQPVATLSSPLASLTKEISPPEDSVAAMQHDAFWEACEEYLIIKTDNVPSQNPALAKYIVGATSAIRSSLACGRLVGVIVLDQDARYEGSYDSSFFAEALSLWTVPSQTEVQQVSRTILQRTLFGTALRFPKQRIRPGEGYVAAVHEGATITEALYLLDRSAGNFIVVTDAQGRLKGAASRQEVVTHVVLAFLETMQR